MRSTVTAFDLWGNKSTIAAHGAWVRSYTNASIVIGVQKSGTTALSELLNLALGIQSVNTHRKELHLFTKPKKLAFWRRRITTFSRERWFTDATPAYFPSLTALLQLRLVLPHAQLWLILRDPVDRCLARPHSRRPCFAFATALSVGAQGVFRMGPEPARRS